MPKVYQRQLSYGEQQALKANQERYQRFLKKRQYDPNVAAAKPNASETIPDASVALRRRAWPGSVWG